MSKKDLQALTLVGPKRNNPVLDSLAVLNLDNRLHVKPPTPKKPPPFY